MTFKCRDSGLVLILGLARLTSPLLSTACGKTRFWTPTSLTPAHLLTLSTLRQGQWAPTWARVSLEQSQGEPEKSRTDNEGNVRLKSFKRSNTFNGC